MELDFKKIQGAGNDFVVVDNMDGRIQLTAEQVAAICDRHFGVGADGVILVEKSPSGADCFMNYINADGSLAQMCGNGVRCVAKFMVDAGYFPKDAPSIAIETRAGVKTISFHLDEAGHVDNATVNMGPAIIDAPTVPTTLVPNAKDAFGNSFVADQPIPSPSGDFRFTCVSMGNPHAVCFIDDWDALPDELFIDSANKSLYTFDIDRVGGYYESCDAFPEKANIEFAEVRQDAIYMRVFERGCGETLACGTGACATEVAAFLTGRASVENDIVLRGGTLHIKLENDGAGDVYMTGPAKESFTGHIVIE